MNILFIGDISGRPGRQAVAQLLPEIRKDNSIDFVIANCENAAGGRGITKPVLNELQASGIDFFTAGEHYWDIKSFIEEIKEQNLPISRPINYEHEENLPGRGLQTYDLGSNGELIVITLLGQTFMRGNVRSPFWVFDELFEGSGEKWKGKTVLIDFHAEATSEKVTFAHYVASKVTAVIGTHTHVGTIDTRIINDHTAFVTDVGMVGPYDSSLWVKLEKTIHNSKYPYKKTFEVEMEGMKVFNSVLLEINKETTDRAKECKEIKRIDHYLK